MTKLALLSVAVTVTLVAGCSHAPPPAPAKVAAPECQTGPEWTCFTSGPCPTPELKGMLCAVGTVENVSSMSLGRETAALKARSEMASVVKTKVDGFRRAVQDSASKAGAGEESIQKIQALSQATVDETLSGVSIPKAYYNEKLKVHFAMAALDAKTFADALRGLKQAGALSDEVKKDIDARAESVVSEWQSTK